MNRWHATAASAAQLDTLKSILEKTGNPEELDGHPWCTSPIVAEAVAAEPELEQLNPGRRLLLAITKVFAETMPSVPPRRGLRLDTHWGEFGILAARYFAPLKYGLPFPTSMRDAWGRIDQAILLFVYGRADGSLAPSEVAHYRLVGDEQEVAPDSTLSDWHRKGLERLAAHIQERQARLERDLAAAQPTETARGLTAPRKKALTRTMQIAAGVLLILILGLGAARAYRVYVVAQKVGGDMRDLRQALPSLPSSQALLKVASELPVVNKDLVDLQTEVGPFLWVGPILSWVPVYGGDLKYLGDLLETASRSSEAASQTFQTALPIWDVIHGQPDLKASDLTSMLIKAQPALLNAQATLGQAAAARQRINLDRLSPASRDLLTQLDSYTATLNQALTLGLAVPSLLGGTSSGPKTYLILVENEDELRPTGGFITAAGKIVVWNGQLMSLTIEDSGLIQDMNKVYPAAPWQMQSFMNIPIFVFRDANWFTDFPTAALWAEYLYALSDNNSVDGVIAIDQQVLTTLLSVTGPVYVSQINTTVTSDNARTVMRAEKTPPPPDQRSPNWDRKEFMDPIATAVLQRLTTGHGISWEQLLKAVQGELDARQILLQLDDPAMEKLLADRGWDGAVRNPGGDFLMVVDTNVGYNKTNAVVNRSLSYDVDLSNPSSPASSLTVFHRNDAVGPAGPCPAPPQINPDPTEYWYPIDRCYYNYLRVYVPAGTQLTAATPHAVSRDEMVMLDQDVPARVDLLDETIPNVQGFGTLLVVPMSSSLQTSFHFSLPAGVIQPGVAGQVYHLKIEKQAGVLAVPVTLRVHLPPGSKIASANLPYVQAGASLLFDLDLRTDVEVQIEFRP